jgi:hypothetical protein
LGCGGEQTLVRWREGSQAAGAAAAAAANSGQALQRMLDGVTEVSLNRTQARVECRFGQAGEASCA